MKYSIFLLLILLISCKSNQENSKEKVHADTLNHKSIDTASTTNNTKSKYYSITNLSKEEYDKVVALSEAKKLYYDYFRLRIDGSYEVNKYLLQNYPTIAKRKDKTLEIYTKSGTKTFIDKVSKNSNINSNDSTFLIIGISKDFVVLQILYHEESGYIVINLNTGQHMNVWGLSYPSPSGKALLSTNIDLNAAFEVNGIQLFILENEQWTKKWEEELPNWGMKDPIWINENTILFKEEKTAYNEGGENKITYKKMVLSGY